MPGALSSNEPETLSSREGGLRLLVRGFSFGAAARELSLPRHDAAVRACYKSLAHPGILGIQSRSHLFLAPNRYRQPTSRCHSLAPAI